jgi:adenylosuccinate lyase
MTGSDDIKSIWATSALDGRYFEQLSDVRSLASEGALMRERLRVEAAWLVHLSGVPQISEMMTFDKAILKLLGELGNGQIPDSLVLKTKDFEKQTNHDVKAVEFALADYLKSTIPSSRASAWIHFTCTSEDINNLSYALILKAVRDKLLIPHLQKIILSLKALSSDNRALAMLSRTHGQTASPTTLGKEMAVFWRRLSRLVTKLRGVPIEGKINGAVGNFNAHTIAFPQVDWINVSQTFVEERLGLQWNPLTTQIECHDSLVEFTDTVRLVNTVLIDFSRDMWGYISVGYFAQKTVAGEVGSSTMPHKVNPIYFENAEGNLGVANALFSFYADKLPISRFQRDLSDSTVLRTLGTSIGHTVLAWQSLLKGLDRVTPNPGEIAKDLEQSWEVLGEAIQTVMRKYGVDDAYDRLKRATRGKASVTRDDIHGLINQAQEIPASERTELLKLAPETYTGLASELVARFVKS